MFIPLSLVGRGCEVTMELNINASSTTHFGLSARVTKDFITPGDTLSARTPFSEMKRDFSFTMLCSFLESKSSCSCSGSQGQN